MDTLSLLLVLGAAGFHAGWNLRLHDAEDGLAALAVAGVVGGALLLPFALARPPGAALWSVPLSALAQSVYGVMLVAAYRRGELSITYPIGRGTAPLLVTVGGWLVVGERPAPVALVGAACLGAGLALVARAGQRAGRTEAVVLALFVGVAIATYSVIDGRAVRLVHPGGYLSLVLLLQGATIWAALRLRGPRLMKALRPGVFIGVASTAAYLLVLVAFRRSPLGRVATLREVAILIGILLSRDRPSLRVWLGSAMVVTGAVLAAA